jgi:hypothetical protein
MIGTQTAKNTVIAMISNCGPQMRLKYLQDLIDNGVRVSRSGSCFSDGEVRNYYSILDPIEFIFVHFFLIQTERTRR